MNDPQQGPRKRVRGHTRKQAIWDFEPGERFTVTFDENVQPIGKEGKELTSFLGTVAKMSQHLEISIKDWRKISQDKKDDLWSIVKEKFEFAPVETEEIRLWVMADINRKWKTWKYELKKRSFDTSLTIDEIVAAQTDSRVDKEDFRKLVTHWFCEETQAVSKKKKVIRSKSNEPHVLGTKSFARLADEEKKKDKDNVRPTRGKLYILSRTRKKNGSIVNENAAKVIEKIKVIASDTSTSTSSTNTAIVDWNNDDLARVKGKERGDYTRCAGPKIRMPKSKRSRVSQVPMLKARINELEDEVKEMKENQAVILQFMANYKNQNPNREFSNVLNSTKTEVATDSSIVDNHGPSGNSTTSGASQNKNSAKAITSPSTHISSAQIQQRRMFLKENGELKKLYVHMVMDGLLSENEFWSIRKVQKLVKERVGLKRGMTSIIKPSHCGQVTET